MSWVEIFAGGVLAGLCTVILVEEAELQRQDPLMRCVAASPAHTDSEVEAAEDACRKVLRHRELLGR